MKIIYISNSHVPCRAANSIHVMNMCEAFAKNGHSVALLTQHEPRYYEKSVGDIFDYYGIKKAFSVTRLPSFKHHLFLSHLYGLLCGVYVLFARPDVVYGRDPAGLFFSALFGKKVIFEIHRPDVVDAFYARKLFRQKGLQYLVSISDKLRELVKQNVNGHKIIVAHDGASCRESQNYEKIKKSYFNEDQLPRVGYVGHLYPGKGGEIVVAVAAKMPHVQFHVFGGYESDIERLRPEASSNVQFHGFVEPGLIGSIVSLLDIVLLPPQQKVAAFGGDQSKAINIGDYMSPLKMFEYMGAGKAIVASDIPVLREVLKHGENALLCDPNDIDGWVKTIESLLEDSERRKELGERARYDYHNNHTWFRRAQHVLNRL